MKHTLSGVLTTHIKLFTTSKINNLSKLTQILQKGFIDTRPVRNVMRLCLEQVYSISDVHKSTSSILEIVHVEVLHSTVKVLEIAPHDIQHSCPCWQIYLRWLHNSQQIYYVGNKTGLWTASCVHLFLIQFHYFCNTPYLDRNTLRYIFPQQLSGDVRNMSSDVILQP